MNKGNIKIFKTRKGDTKIQVRLEKETVWLDVYQIASIFWKDRTTIQRHIKNIYNTWELMEEWTCAKNAQVQIEWKRSIKRASNFYNLDMILSVGYRVNSKEATSFRIWATSILKDYIVKWYSLNQKRLQEKGYKDLEWAIKLVKNALSSWDVSKNEALWLVDIITNYTDSWILLQQYDKDELSEKGGTKKLRYRLDTKEALSSLSELKKNLLNKKEATELFAQERQDNTLQGIFWNIYQTFDGNELYPSIESKAAHLLYFIVKDHPFTDGNKRSGAFLFILFLAQNRILFETDGTKKINERALVAITLLIAGSNPKDKELMTNLVINLIN